jgi:hypothetical protein
MCCQFCRHRVRTLCERQPVHARPRAATRSRPIPFVCRAFVVAVSGACPPVPRRTSMVRRGPRFESPLALGVPSISRGGQKFAEPVALSSAQPADRPLPRRALRQSLNLVTLRARRTLEPKWPGSQVRTRKWCADTLVPPRKAGASSAARTTAFRPKRRRDRSQRWLLLAQGAGAPRLRLCRIGACCAVLVEPWICLRTGKWVIPGCAGGARSPASRSD